jgi:hypothetical protein
MVLPGMCRKIIYSFGSVWEIANYSTTNSFSYTQRRIPSICQVITTLSLQPPSRHHCANAKLCLCFLPLFLTTKKSTFLLFCPVVFCILVLLLKLSLAASVVAIGTVRSEGAATARAHAQGSQTSRRWNWWGCIVRVGQIVISWTFGQSTSCRET